MGAGVGAATCVAAERLVVLHAAQTPQQQAAEVRAAYLVHEGDSARSREAEVAARHLMGVVPALQVALYRTAAHWGNRRGWAASVDCAVVLHGAVLAGDDVEVFIGICSKQARGADYVPDVWVWHRRALRQASGQCAVQNTQKCATPEDGTVEVMPRHHLHW